MFPCLRYRARLGSWFIALLASVAVIAEEQATPEASCLCLWQGGFAEVQADADLVAAVTITLSKGNSVDVSVDQILRGTEYNESVRLWLRARDYCRPEAEEFPVGSRWVMALQRINDQVPGGFNPDTPNISYGRIGDYALSSCGGYWLALSDNRVTGNLIDAPRWERDPKMSPVLLELLVSYVRGDITRDALREARREDPALRELMLNTKEFLRETR
ncbi:MAG: delta-aminolevulinic acid dehydratase [Haliea sp.]|nr:delta-aminolevulinic acid dehydratase [Haliea sp.]MDP4916780.1 delta-aminolevulinic acid dehydratase [Haliea sp.]